MFRNAMQIIKPLRDYFTVFKVFTDEDFDYERLDSVRLCMVVGRTGKSFF